MSNPERPPVESFYVSLFRRYPVATAIIAIVVFLVWTFPIGFAQAWPAFVKDKTIPEWLEERRWPGMTAQLYGWLTIVFFLTLVILLVAIIIVSRRRGAPAQTVPAAEQVPAANVEQPDRIKELEEALKVSGREKEHFRNEAAKARESAETHSIRATMNQGLLDQNRWLLDVARKDREQMQYLVIVESCKPVNHSLESAEAPFIEYLITVFNASVYPIQIQEGVKGRMYYREPNYLLTAEPSITENAADWIKRGTRATFKLYQWLAPHECDLIRRFTAEHPDKDYYTTLRPEKVNIYFTVDYRNETTATFTLNLPLSVELPLFKEVPPTLRADELKARIEELERENEELKAASSKPEKRGTVAAVVEASNRPTANERPLVCLRTDVIQTQWKGEVICKVEKSEKSFDTAIAEFANSPNAQGWIYPLQYLNAQLTYYDSEGKYRHRVSRSFWVGAEEYYIHLRAGDLGQLVIAVAYKDAVFVIDNPNPKDYRIPEKDPFMLEGDRFRVLVCLTEDNSASSAVNFAFNLICKPELRIEEAELEQESEPKDA